MNDVPQEIKARLPIEDLVAQYVQLKKIGRSFKGLCPFHSEKTPSFIVSPDKGIAYCFGCHRGGDVFKFLQEIEGIDFPDALKILAERTGVKLETYKVEKKISTDEKDQLLRIHESATIFYEKQLWGTKDGEKVLEYVRARGLTDETIKFFRLGFSPDSFEDTLTMLLHEGFQKKILVASGLAMAKDTTFEKIYDRFRGRLMFPIADSLGRIVAFGGRALKKDQEPKYLNSPETSIYHKGAILYSFSQAKPFIKKNESVVIVEGYMDALAAYQAGSRAVVASSGTALTLQQLRLLQPLARLLYLAFDMDHAGQEAAARAYELSRDLDFEVKIVQLPSAKDIAEFTKEHAPELSSIILTADSYGEYFYKRLFALYGKEHFSEKHKILEEFYPFFSRLKGSLEKDFFVRKLASDLQLSEIQVYDEMKNFKLPSYHPARNYESKGSLIVQSKKYLPDELLLGFMIEFPRIGVMFLKKVTGVFFRDELKAIYNAFADYYNAHDLDEVGVFIASLPQNLAEQAALLSLYVREQYGEMGEVMAEKEMNVLIDSIEKRFLLSRRKELQQKIKEAEDRGDKLLSLELVRDFKNLPAH